MKGMVVDLDWVVLVVSMKQVWINLSRWQLGVW